EPRVKVMPAETWIDQLVAGTRQADRIVGAKLPWSKTHELIRFRPGEVTLWLGINGHGKSEVLGQACLGFAAQDERSCIASFEMRPVKTLRRMLRQTSQNEQPGETAVRRMMSWLVGRMWIYDQMGRANVKTLAAVI